MNIHHRNCFRRNLRGSLAHRSGPTQKSCGKKPWELQISWSSFSKRPTLFWGGRWYPKTKKTWPMWDSSGTNDVNMSNLMSNLSNHSCSIWWSCWQLSTPVTSSTYLETCGSTLNDHHFRVQKLKWKWQWVGKNPKFPMKMQVWSPALEASIFRLCFNSVLHWSLPNASANRLIAKIVCNLCHLTQGIKTSLHSLIPRLQTSDHHTLLGPWRQYTTTLSTKSNTAYNQWVSALPNVSGHESNPLWQ
jgi:hypothetical protein